MITSRPCTLRLLPIEWTYRKHGLPRSFETKDGWVEWVIETLDMAGLNEDWLLEDGYHVGYLAWTDGRCIHHRGEVLDVQMLVMAPSCKMTSSIWQCLKDTARRKGYSWIARRKHQPDGSIKTIYTEV